MPIYEFRCKNCRKVFEELVHGGKETQVACPDCGGSQHEKLMSTFSGRMAKKIPNPDCRETGCAGSACRFSEQCHVD